MTNPPMMPPSADMDMSGGVVRQRVHQRKRRKASGMPDNWAWVVIAAALLGVTIIISMLLVVAIRFAMSDDDTLALAEAPLVEPTSIIYTGGEGGALEGNSLELQNKKWDGKERFTILLMGLDKRPDEGGTVFRTDSMILVSLDPQTNSIGMLSIPRDLYVEVPYAGLQRVNAAYVIGELEEPNGGGPRLAKQTVQYNFGIPVNEFITVDFQTVISVIDAIGGVEIEVPNEITDYEYPTMDYGTEIFHVDAGWQTMDGTTALKYARTRHASDDIDRAKRQQQVIYAVRDKVTSLDMIDDLIVQAPFLYGELKAGINTGLSFDQMIELALWAADVPRENIHSGVVSWEYLTGYQTPSGGSVLVPDRALIGGLMVQVFGADYNQP
jgi:LCP family protein required for cell wall assembly